MIEVNYELTKERYTLAIERIREIVNETETEEVNRYMSYNSVSFF